MQDHTIRQCDGPYWGSIIGKKILQWVFADKLCYSEIHFNPNIQRSYREFKDDLHKHRKDIACYVPTPQPG